MKAASSTSHGRPRVVAMRSTDALHCVVDCQRGAEYEAGEASEGGSMRTVQSVVRQVRCDAVRVITQGGHAERCNKGGQAGSRGEGLAVGSPVEEW